MEWVAIVTVLLALQVIFFGIRSGRARIKYDVKAPAMDGPEEFERLKRVHLNTVEQSVVVFPLLWAAAFSFSRPEYAAILGLVYLVGRFLFSASYISAPESRAPGMIIGFLATIGLALLTLWGGDKQAACWLTFVQWGRQLFLKGVAKIAAAGEC